MLSLAWFSCRQITIEEGEQRAKELNVMFIETSAKTGCNVKQVISAVSPYFRAFWSSLDGRFTFRFKMCNTDNHIWCTLYSVLLTHFTLVGGYIEFKSRRLSKLHIAIEDHNIHHLKFNYCLPQYSELYTGLVTHIFTHLSREILLNAWEKKREVGRKGFNPKLWGEVIMAKQHITSWEMTQTRCF